MVVGPGGGAPRVLAREPQVVDLGDRETERRVSLLHDERVAAGPDETQLPEDLAVVERDLPAVVPLRRDRRGAQQDHPGDPESSHCPSTFPAFAASAAFFFNFFFLRRVVPYVPRKILPRLVRMSPLPIRRSPLSVFRPPLLPPPQPHDAFELGRPCRHH